MSIMSSPVAVKVDAKGRLLVPGALRDRLGIQPGDTLFVECDNDQSVLRFAKATNPFDILAEHAVNEWRLGRTRSLRTFAAENDIRLDGE